MSSEISITYDGREALTLDQFAAEAGTLKDGESARAVLSRFGVKPLAHLGAIYDAEEARNVLATRPGRTGRPRKEKPMYTITDANGGHSATVAYDQVADTLRPWFEGAPDEVTQAIADLETALTPGSSTAHEQDALATYLDVTVQPA